MTRSKRLDPVANIARRAEQDAAQALSTSRRVLDEAEARLADLRASRQAYARQFETNAGLTIGAAQMRQYRVFVQRLDEAIAVLEGQVERKRARVEADRGQWLSQRLRAEALSDLVDRHRRAEVRSAERRSQDEIDDLTQRPRGEA